MYVHHRTPARVRRPSRAKRVNALRSRMRQIKPTGCAGPWRGVTSARLARRGCSSGDGSRASWRGDDCSVGRCASRNPPRPHTMVRSTFRWQVRIWKGSRRNYSAKTRPNDKARAPGRRIATATWGLRLHAPPAGPIRARSGTTGKPASVPSLPRNLICPHHVDKCVEKGRLKEPRCR